VSISWGIFVRDSHGNAINPFDIFHWLDANTVLHFNPVSIVILSSYNDRNETILKPLRTSKRMQEKCFLSNSIGKVKNVSQTCNDIRMQVLDILVNQIFLI